ncbi:MAG: tRNA adenosine(34) deaminase TadA [Betaproteobacteria bacterium]|nr:tRNA adenosine(34) deaminase TadA [Betaproteobacteria bacterium]
MTDIGYADSHWMRLALNQADLAAQEGEVPVGAVVVKDGQLIASGRNAPIASHDPSAHAEVLALRAAAAALGNYRLDGCELFVTLEPCAMCSGAMLHARLKRVIFGATDPRTGAAGSVVDLFADARLNHQTEVQGGVLAAEATLALQSFFKPRRLNAQPVREDALRTPESCFSSLPDYPWPAQYLDALPALDGLRMHYLDVPPDPGVSPSGLTYLCLHGEADWSYAFREHIPAWTRAGHRVLAPDLVGFGKSDKPKKDAFHTLDFHQRVLREFVAQLRVDKLVLVVPEEGAIVGLTLGFQVLQIPIAPMEPARAYDAPFPDRGHRAGPRAFAQLRACNLL